MLARPAAIKLIRPSFAGDARAGVSEEAVRRFEREAQILASLCQRNIAGIHGFDM